MHDIMKHVIIGGFAARRLKQLNIPYHTVTTKTVAHADYYPKAFPLTLKRVFDPETGKRYGRQCAGTGWRTAAWLRT